MSSDTGAQFLADLSVRIGDEDVGKKHLEAFAQLLIEKYSGDFLKCGVIQLAILLQVIHAYIERRFYTLYLILLLLIFISSEMTACKYEN
jgi:hypothetical protein